ncbi:MAG: FAD-dependent oxidoreductase [Nanoarchaeota archaeon]|nr:FAD-dependent oxidoreductase [Nanoarchaeota archaeon]
MSRLVIIGGGFAGAKIAKKLENKFETILIDKKDFFEFTPGILRTIVNPKLLRKIQKKHKNYLRDTIFIKDSVFKINKRKIFLKNSAPIDFDYLVIASGSRYNSPIKSENILIADRGKNIKEYHEKLRKSENIIVVGGGIVGVEMTSEICTKYPGKRVTLIHNKRELLERNHHKSREIAYNFLRKRGVRVIIREKVLKYDGKIVETDRKNKFLADMVISCTGIIPNSKFVDEESMDEDGFILVNEFLQMKRNKNIFVCGDAASLEEEKTAQGAEKQADLVINNILALEKNKFLKKYISKRRPMVISLGKFNGIFENENFVINGFIPAFMKWFVQKRTMFRYIK